MEKQKNIPQLRFPEFKGDWENKTLGTLSDVRDGTHESPKYVEEGYPLVTSKNLTSDGQLDLSDITYISKEDFDAINKRSRVSINDILFGMIGTIGNPVQIKEEGFAIKNVALIKEKHALINKYLINYLNTDSIRKQFYKENTGGTQKFLALNVIRNLAISFPKLDEQQKIASFFTSIDQKISQLKRKKNLLEQYKKWVMQKVFSQEVRFRDDSGHEFPKWEKRKLGDVGKTYNGLSGKSKDDFGQGKPYIQYKQIFDDTRIDITRFDYVRIRDGEKQCRVRYGDVFFTTSSETPDEVGTSSVLLDEVSEVYLNSFCFGYRSSRDVLIPHFSRYLFRNALLRKEINKLAQGSTRYNISKNELMKTVIDLPTIQEQTKIANFLSAIDEKINNTRKQIEKAEVWKKGLMQQMFI